MSDLFNLSEPSNNFGLKAKQDNSKNVLMMNNAVEDRHKDDPLLKATYPVYLYRPPFGYPRNVNVVFLRELAQNPYVFSVLKTITDQAAETPWHVKPKDGVVLETPLDKLDLGEESIGKVRSLQEQGFKTLADVQRYLTEFFKNPNSDNESFAQLLRKVIPDILVLDSGVFNKVYNLKGDLLQLRVIDGGTILKNPDEHGSLADREDIIIDNSYYGLGAGKGFQRKEQAYKYAIDRYNSYGYDQDAAYFQFAYGINYSVPVPYGRKELIYMMENPSTETVYSRNSALQSAVDITLNLIYSSKASLDLFLNANIPTGIIKLAEADEQDTQTFQNKLYQQQYSGYDEYGYQRKVNGRMPVVGNPNVDFIPLNFKNNEAQLLEIQQWFTKVLWSCFGVTAEEMGFTEDSNKATSQSQTETNARKAVRPRLNMIGNFLTDQVLTDLPLGDLFEFVFEDNDEKDEKNKWEIYEKKINLGVMTPKQVAEQEGIEYISGEAEQKETEAKSSTTQSGGEGLTSPGTLLDVDYSNGKRKQVETKPFGGYDDFQDCVSKNQDKDDPEAYCGSIQNKVEGKSIYEFEGNYVLTGETKEDLLRQAVELLKGEEDMEESEDEDEDNNEGDNPLFDNVKDDAQEHLQKEEEVAQQSEYKSSLSEEERTPPEQAKKNAKKVLDWKEKYPDEIQGMTETGWRRARQLAEGKPLSEDVINRMAQFRRHQKNAKIEEESEGKPWTDNGRVAWLGWGGEAGVAWAERMSKKIDEQKTETKSISEKEKDELRDDIAKQTPLEQVIKRMLQDYEKKTKEIIDKTEGDEGNGTS